MYTCLNQCFHPPTIPQLKNFRLHRPMRWPLISNLCLHPRNWHTWSLTGLGIFTSRLMKAIIFEANSPPAASHITLRTLFATPIWTLWVCRSPPPARAAHSNTTIPRKVLSNGRPMTFHARRISSQYTARSASLITMPSIYPRITLNTLPFPLPNILHTPSSQLMFSIYRSSVALSRRFQKLPSPPPSPIFNKLRLRRNGRKGLRLILI